MLSVAGLHAHYGRAHILDDVALEVAAGEVVVLLGRNGAGKSTTMKAIMGLVPPSAGRISFAGAEIAGWEPFRIARLGLGYVPEERRIFTELTVLENLEVGRRPAPPGLRPWTPERLFALFPSLGAMQDRPGGRMSGGEQQMLTIARTLMGNPKLVLLDEPSEGLAPVIIERMAATIHTLKAEGLAILLSEQNLHFAQAVSDRATIIEKGRIRWSGTVADADGGGCRQGTVPVGLGSRPSAPTTRTASPSTSAAPRISPADSSAPARASPASRAASATAAGKAPTATVTGRPPRSLSGSSVSAGDAADGRMLGIDRIGDDRRRRIRLGRGGGQHRHRIGDAKGEAAARPAAGGDAAHRVLGAEADERLRHRPFQPLHHADLQRRPGRQEQRDVAAVVHMRRGQPRGAGQRRQHLLRHRPGDGGHGRDEAGAEGPDGIRHAPGHRAAECGRSGPIGARSSGNSATRPASRPSKAAVARRAASAMAARLPSSPITRSIGPSCRCRRPSGSSVARAPATGCPPATHHAAPYRRIRPAPAPAAPHGPHARRAGHRGRRAG